MRRPEGVARGPVALTVTQTDPGGDLPSFTPAQPPGDWTPAAVFSAAVDYSLDEGADAALLNPRRVILAAEAALFRALPAAKQAQIVERLRGVDRHRDYFGETRRVAPAQPAEVEVEPDDEAPF